MKNLFLGLFMLFFGLVGAIPDAEARRMGGGGNFGMQRQVNPAPSPRPPAASRQQSPSRQQPAAAPGTRSWLGPIAGLAAGLGIAALFSHLGLGEELASFVMLALLAFGALMLFRMFMRRSAVRTDERTAMQFAGPSADLGSARINGKSAVAASPGTKGSLDSSGSRENFDREAFARQAKVQFIRLQAAHDAANLDDIRTFTTPEVFAEIRQQIAERSSIEQRTDVVELVAEVIDVTEDSRQYIVSVRFSGSLRESPDTAPSDFAEIWHLTKPLGGSSGWVIAGIQQAA
ncbi:MAG TPA: Tim44-like domain-containing protein [Rhodocyclaceae bacterium]|nr:Tim44-like domain-containing protein [Rhodocyclaceae bacterium]